MSIQPVTYYQVRCDSCNGLYDSREYGAYSNAQWASVVAVDDGWRTDDNYEQHWCPGCQVCPTGHLPKKEDDECPRCGEDLFERPHDR